MFSKNPDFPFVLDNRYAAALLVIELFPVIESFSFPDGVYNGGIPLNLKGEVFAVHGLQLIYIGSCGCNDVFAVKGFPRLGIIHIVFR